jgi:hypothetical protein
MMTTKGITSPAPNSPNWDVPLNANFSAIEKAFGDATSITTTAGAVTLNADQIGHMCLRCTGALTADLTLRVPSGTAGQWVVVNTTTDAAGGPWSVSITSLAGGTPIEVERGSARSVYADGTSNGVVFADTIIIPGSDNQIIYNDAGALTGSSALTFDGAAVSVGGSTATTGASWSAGTATVTFSNGQTIPVGSVVSVTGVTPAGYNGSRVTTGTAALNQVQFAVAADPGAYASAGTISYGNLNLGGSKIGGIASQELAEAGTNDNTIMTPLKTEQHTLSNDLGWSQTWQSMIGSRAVSVSYQNTTTRPIQFSIRLDTTSSDRVIEVSADNINWVRVGTSYSSFQPFNTAVVPVGHYYRVNGSATILNWAELR